MYHRLPTIEQLTEAAATEWEPDYTVTPIVAWEQWQRASATWMVCHLFRLCEEGTFPRLALVRVLKRVFRAHVPVLVHCGVSGNAYPFAYFVKSTLGVLDACENFVTGRNGSLDDVIFGQWSRGVDARRESDRIHDLWRYHDAGTRFDANHQDFMVKYLRTMELFATGCSKDDYKSASFAGAYEFRCAITAFLDAFERLWLVQNHRIEAPYKRAYMNADLARVIRAAPEVDAFTATLTGPRRDEPAPSETMDFDFTTGSTLRYDSDGRCHRASSDYDRCFDPVEKVPITALWSNELRARKAYSENVRLDARNSAIIAENERIRRAQPEEPGSGIRVGDREDWDAALRRPTFRFLAEYAHLTDPTSRRQFFDP